MRRHGVDVCFQVWVSEDCDEGILESGKFELEAWACEPCNALLAVQLLCERCVTLETWEWWFGYEDVGSLWITVTEPHWLMGKYALTLDRNIRYTVRKVVERAS